MPLSFYELQKPGNYFIDIYNILAQETWQPEFRYFKRDWGEAHKFEKKDRPKV